MKPEFYIGQRIMYNIHGSDAKGTIISDEHLEKYNMYSVRFDEYKYELHNLGGLCEDGYGWFCMPSFMIPLDEDPELVPEYALESAEVLYG